MQPFKFNSFIYNLTFYLTQDVSHSNYISWELIHLDSIVVRQTYQDIIIFPFIVLNPCLIGVGFLLL